MSVICSAVSDSLWLHRPMIHGILQSRTLEYWCGWPVLVRECYQISVLLLNCRRAGMFRIRMIPQLWPMASCTFSVWTWESGTQVPFHVMNTMLPGDIFVEQISPSHCSKRTHTSVPCPMMAQSLFFPSLLNASRISLPILRIVSDGTPIP